MLALAGCDRWASGRLEWEAKRQDVLVLPGGGAREVKFRFRNVGRGPVTLVGFDADCRCTVAQGRLRRYEPGEDGELPINIHFGSNWGRQRKRIRVQTNEPGAPWHVLEVDGRVAEGTVSPALVRAHDLLARWMALADTLPVHDLLDRIYHEGDLPARYAAAVPPALRPAVAANLQAFMELALAVA